MPYREPAPRYSRPIPVSLLFPVDQPRGIVREFIRREAADHMTATGFALGSLAIVVAIVARCLV
jgi:hypothetical protein